MALRAATAGALFGLSKAGALGRLAGQSRALKAGQHKAGTLSKPSRSAMGRRRETGMVGG